ncbi:hypothetical protein KC207_05765 [Phycicoccus sp. BSK3Z-2]|uniref:Uncharacterized protein n=1 Tax=Phycicoccus avicenniae TaxID=2828860 RepID=A0A941DAE4_9MICO|nr:hypothetical protein [Phycicoccus avicenniae]MBR7742797.1 hypothetical protein [Phycicoccus avicenniae]
MLPVVLVLVVLVALALLVLATVAVPARRGGREVLTDRGEHLVESFRHRGRDRVTSAGDTPDERVLTGPRA